MLYQSAEAVEEPAGYKFFIYNNDKYYLVVISKDTNKRIKRELTKLLADCDFLLLKAGELYKCVGTTFETMKTGVAYFASDFLLGALSCLDGSIRKDPPVSAEFTNWHEGFAVCINDMLYISSSTVHIYNALSFTQPSTRKPPKADFVLNTTRGDLSIRRIGMNFQLWWRDLEVLSTVNNEQLRKSVTALLLFKDLHNFFDNDGSFLEGLAARGEDLFYDNKTVYSFTKIKDASNYTFDGPIFTFDGYKIYYCPLAKVFATKGSLGQWDVFNFALKKDMLTWIKYCCTQTVYGKTERYPSGR